MLKFVGWVGGALFVLAVIARFTIMDVWTIPEDNDWLGVSIAPTLYPGDEVVLITGFELGFGELVRCKDPDDDDAWVIGRIAGVEGDMVVVAGPTLRVNGTTYSSSEACVDNTFIVDHPKTNREVEVQCSRVDMGGGWHFRGTARKYQRKGDKKKLVGSDKFFLLSDNRDLHFDSRDFSVVDVDSCDARIAFRLYSVEGWSDTDYRFTVIR